MSLQREKMSNVDTAWWHMESPVNLMMITTIMVFEGRPDYQRITDTVAARILQFDRFRQRVVDPAAPWSATRWELDPHFDLNAHIHRLALPEPGDQATLEELVSDLISAPLDYSKPLWQMHIVENYEGDNFVVITRLHHCIADGIALMRVLLSLTDDEPDVQLKPAAPRMPRSPDGLLSSITRPVAGLAGAAANLAETAVQVGATAVRGGMTAVRDPQKVMDGARGATDFLARLGLVTLRLPDPPTIYKGELTSRKRVSWSAAAPLDAVKNSAAAMGGTINDFMVSAVTGALRRYMEEQGIQTADLNFRAYIPVNLRPSEEAIKLGNAFGLVFLSLPVGVVDRGQRFSVVHKRMEELKNSPEAAVAITLLNAAGMFPKEIENAAFRIYHAKATAVLTNVPGPSHQLYFAGRPLRYMMGWVPQAGSLGLGISILSYNGEVMLGINTDAGLVPDPEKIIEYFEDEMVWMLETGELLAA
jgi:diacylglycerol O-acyltransferase